MSMRSLRTLPLLVGVLAIALAPSDALAQRRPRTVPYHMLLAAGADAPGTDQSLASSLQRASAVSPAGVRWQTPYVPYFFQNKVRYDKFEWHIYKTDHFEIFYYPDLEQHLERVTSYAESAYQRISGELKHDLAGRVPLVLFKTQSEFQENNISGDTPEGVLAFAEPERNRMVLPIDEPPDQLYALITHELTHIFEFDIIPRGIISEGLPLWVDEGLANYMTGTWNVLDLVAVRDAALTDNVPPMSRYETAPLSGRAPYSMGQATFEFIEARWGKEGLRQFLFSLRKSVLGGGETAYEEALKLKPEDFDEQFDRYIKERFKPFRDKERPADYGRNLGPDPERTPYVAVTSIEPSPSGDMLAAVVGNRRDREYDIILLSSKDGQFIRNLTTGFDKDRGFEYIGTPGGLRGNMVPWIAWAPVGDRIAYFARTEKSKTLVIQQIVSGRTEKRLLLSQLDAPESPAFSPDGRKVAFAGISAGLTDIYVVDIATEALTNVTKDTIADYAPTFSPDGKAVVYTARVGSNDKLFRVDLATGAKTQLTFGSHDDTGARFLDERTLVFTSTATDPAVSIPTEVARWGNIPNVWTLDLETRQLRQLTDTATGNVSPIVLRDAGTPRIAFISYYKGRNGIHTITGEKPIATVASDDFGGPGPVFEFTAPISHTLLRENIRKKGAFEKMTMAGRPPVALGVTTGGYLYGNTMVTFTDVLGDKEVSFYAQSVLQYRTTALTYVNTGRRLQYALQGFSQDLFYFGAGLAASGALYDPALAPYISRDLAEAVQSQRGGTAFAIYPFNRYSRAELFTGYMHVDEHYTNPALQAEAEAYQQETYGTSLFRSGHMLPVGISFVTDRTIFREYGPVAGNAYKLTYSGSPRFGDSWLSKNTMIGDIRHYKRIAANGVLATRFYGHRSWGTNPDFFNFGGNSEMRGYQYLEFIGHKGYFANAELRFPLIEAMLTPIGVLGGLRGVLFANVGGASFNGQQFTTLRRRSETVEAISSYQLDTAGDIVGMTTQQIPVSGFRLVDARGSYGFGLESFMLGFPMHFDFSWKTLFNKGWEDVVFRACEQTGPLTVTCAPTDEFRKMKFDFWIGYDF
ncbi:MAG: PD40 domain-containing protein [Acidobacteria bacterium]|nr:PD40 domain-containing protein [Acidobacteriota bacterium]